MALTLFLVFLYAIGTSVALPTPLEAALGGIRFAPAWAVIGVAVVGKFIGAYLIFFLGVKLKRLPAVENWQTRNPFARRLVGFGKRWVDRFGAPALFFLLLIPGFPDTGALYLTALIGGRPVAFSLATAAAGSLRLTLAYLGIWGATQALS